MQPQIEQKQPHGRKGGPDELRTWWRARQQLLKKGAAAAQHHPVHIP